MTSAIDAGGVSDDPRVRDAYVKLMLTAIAEAREILDHGTPNVKAPLIARLLTSAEKSIREKGDDEQLSGVRDALTDLYASLGVEMGAEPAPE